MQLCTELLQLLFHPLTPGWFSYRKHSGLTSLSIVSMQELSRLFFITLFIVLFHENDITNILGPHPDYRPDSYLVIFASKLTLFQLSHAFLKLAFHFPELPILYLTNLRKAKLHRIFLVTQDPPRTLTQFCKTFMPKPQIFILASLI